MWGRGNESNGRFEDFGYGLLGTTKLKKLPPHHENEDILLPQTIPLPTRVKNRIKAFRDHPIVLPIFVTALHGLRRLGLFRGEAFYMHVPYRGLVQVHVPNGKAFSVVARGGQVENRLYWDGILGHEPASMSSWVKYAAKAVTVLDVGANSGIFALAAAAAGARRVHAFEPVERIHSALLENIKGSEFENVSAWHCAVGQFDGVAEMQDPGGYAPTSASLSSEFASFHLGATTLTRVEVVSIDSWAERNSVSTIDMIKVDIEGYEEFALRGMKRVVSRDQPVVLIEVLEEYESRIRAVVNEIFGPAYSWNRVDEGQGDLNRNVLLLPAHIPR